MEAELIQKILYIKYERTSGGTILRKIVDVTKPTHLRFFSRIRHHSVFIDDDDKRIS